MDISERLAHAYFFAKSYVIGKGYSYEIDWQDNLHFEKLTEQKFMNEIAWVILASGMSDRVIQKVFPLIKIVFFDFRSSKLILKKRNSCANNATKIFNNKR